MFVSYSDDSAAHAKRVLELAQWLRSHGVDAQIDQFEESPEEGWPRWVHRQIREAEFVLVVATPGYLRRCEGDEPRTNASDSAVKFGSHLTLQELHEAGGRNRKFVPLLFDEDAIVESVPLPLRGATCYRLPAQRDDLYRRLTGQPKFQRVPLGVLKTFDDESLYDSVDEDSSTRRRAALDEQQADDSLRVMVDAGVLPDDGHEEPPRRRLRDGWSWTSRHWMISIVAFAAAFMAIGLVLNKRETGTTGEPKCRIQLTDSSGAVINGIDRVILELPSGDEIGVVVEDGHTLEFACLSSTTQAQAHVYLRLGTELEVAATYPESPPRRANRLDGRIALPSAAEFAGEQIKQARLVSPEQPELEVGKAQPDDE